MRKRPAIRYHGGKWRLAPWIISHFGPHKVYTEAFGGGASVLLRKDKSYAEIYNDMDGEIVNFFRVLRDHAKEFERRVRLTPFAREEFDLSYEPCDDPIEQARRTLVRGGMGFGSSGTSGLQRTGFRGSATRSGTTPAHVWSNQIANLSAICERLGGVVIENRPGIDVIQYHDAPSTLHYVDPPYAHVTRTRSSKKSYRYEMTDDDHESLAEVLHHVKGAVILSGYDCELYARLYAGWAKQTKSAFADQAKPRVECLWLNARAVESMPQKLLEVG